MTDQKPLIDEVVVGNLARLIQERGIDALELLESKDGETLIREVVQRFDYLKKVIVEIPILVRLPNLTDVAESRARALQRIHKLLATAGHKLPSPFTREHAIQFLGADTVDGQENLLLLEVCLRRPDDPDRPYMTADNLDRMHPTNALNALVARMGEYRQRLDVRLIPGDFKDEATFWRLVRLVAKEGHIGPLVVTGGPGMAAFIVTMAVRLHASQTQTSSPQSSASSTPTV